MIELVSLQKYDHVRHIKSIQGSQCLQEPIVLAVEDQSIDDDDSSTSTGQSIDMAFIYLR
jgi:hypothetical protein